METRVHLLVFGVNENEEIARYNKRNMSMYNICVIETSWYKRIKYFIPSKIRYIFSKKAMCNREDYKKLSVS